MSVTSSQLPSEIRAGDTLRWRRSLSDYPASAGWQLRYTLISATAVHSFASTGDGDAHWVVVAASTTANWEAGIYRLVEAATLGTERYTLGERTVRVLPDLASAVSGVDTRTHAEKVLAAIESYLEGKAGTGWAASLEVAGRKLSEYPLSDLLRLRDLYRAEVSRDRQQAAGAPPARVLARL